MANNLDNAIDVIMASTIEILRENAVMPRLVNTSYSTQAQEMGDSIDIPITSSLAVRDVVPSQTSSNTGLNDVIPTKATLQLDNWKEVAFTMSDKELKEVEAGLPPRVLDEAVRAIINSIDDSILALYKKVYNSVGTAGTTPFSASLLPAQEAFVKLNTELIPRDNRSIVLDPFAEGNAIGLPQLQKVNEAGTDETLREARIGRLLGFSWYQDQNVANHTTGASGTIAVDFASNYAIGASSILIDNGSGALVSGAPAVGDVFTFAGHSQQYTVVSYTAASTEGTLVISPALKAAVSDNEVLTFVASHTANLAFHRDAFAFASRPLLDTIAPGVILRSVSDPISGVTVRLEIKRENKRTLYSMDALWGVTCVRPEMAVRILG